MNSLKELRKHNVLIAAHRGTNGGNIVQNTIAAYENSLRHQADMIEVDVIRSIDGEFFAFHDGQEDIVFGQAIDLLKMTSDEITSQVMRNTSGEYINQRVERIDDVLNHFTDRCWINIDRSWFYWDTFLETLKQAPSLSQILLKSPAEKQYLDLLSAANLPVNYMPIVKNKAELELVLSYENINTVAVEIIFETLESDLIDPLYLKGLHDKGLLLWVNALTLNDRTILSGGLDDNKAILESEEASWGKLIDMGFDIIQTDWPLLLKNYMNIKR